MGDGLHLHLLPAHRRSDQDEVSVLVGHGTEARAEDDDVRVGNRAATLLDDLPGDAPGRAGGGLLGVRQGRRQEGEREGRDRETPVTMNHAEQPPLGATVRCSVHRTDTR